MASLTDSGERIIAEQTSSTVEYSNDTEHQFTFTYQKQQIPELDLDLFYDLQECTQIIHNYFKENTSKPFFKIALQFPDELLLDASLVTSRLHELLNTNQQIHFQTYILGDTTYSNCCVDVIAAQHVQSDFLIHFGNACLQSIQQQVSYSIPIHHCFGKFFLWNESQCRETLTRQFTPNQHLILVFDCMLYSQISQWKFESNQVTVIQFDSQRVTQLPSSAQNSDSFFGMQLPSNFSTSNELHLVYLGTHETRMQQCFLELNYLQPTQTWHYNIQTMECKPYTQTSRYYMREYYMMEQVKQAQVFGLLVTNVSIANTMQMVEQCEEWIRQFGKKSYTFYVGKINVAKLNNFMDIDCFVMIGCGQHNLNWILKYYKEVGKALCTPFELKKALQQYTPSAHEEQVGKFSTDFNTLLQAVQEAEELLPSTTKEEEIVDYNFITKSIVTLKHKPTISSTTNHQNQLLSVLTSGEVMNSEQIEKVNQQIYEMSPALQFLHQQRSYQGLSHEVSQEKFSQMEKGLHGIAKEYEEEKK